jgi:hypothetical protein
VLLNDIKTLLRERPQEAAALASQLPAGRFSGMLRQHAVST